MKIFKFILFISFSLFIILSFNYNEEEPVIELKVKNKQINSYKDNIEYQLTNNTENTYILYLDTEILQKDIFSSVIYTSTLNISDNILKNSYLIYDKKDSIFRFLASVESKKEWKKSKIRYDKFWKNKRIEESIYLEKHINNYKNYEREWILVNRYLRKNSIIIKPKEIIQLSSKVKINQETEKHNLFYSFYLLQKDSIYNFQQIIRVDSNNIKKYLLPKQLDSLRENNIKIFHGELRSNKVLIKVNKKDLIDNY